VILRTVAFNEIILNRLKAGMEAISHQRSKRRITTARVILRAVASVKTTFYLLPAKT
jgi:hypothetical protein